MFEIRSNGRYWIDDNGNMWRKTAYSKEDALSLSKTLKDCRGCIDCGYCNDCRQCEDCQYCYRCEGSVACKFCEGCEQCSRCHHCSRCSYCHYCTRCDSCTHCATVVAVRDCRECNDIYNTISDLNRYRWAQNYTVIYTSAGKVTILVDDYHNLWYQIDCHPQTDWDCFAFDFKRNGESVDRDPDAIKSELEYIKSLGEFFHKTVKERNKENDCKDGSTDGAAALDF